MRLKTRAKKKLRQALRRSEKVVLMDIKKVAEQQKKRKVKIMQTRMSE